MLSGISGAAPDAWGMWLGERGVNLGDGCTCATSLRCLWTAAAGKGGLCDVTVLVEGRQPFPRAPAVLATCSAYFHARLALAWPRRATHALPGRGGGSSPAVHAANCLPWLIPLKTKPALPVILARASAASHLTCFSIFCVNWFTLLFWRTSRQGGS